MASRTPTLPLFGLIPLLACNPAVEETPGEETSPCNDGLCLEGLECLSDVCVDPDGGTGGTTGPTTMTVGETESASGTTGGTNPTADDSGGPSDASTDVDVLFVVDNSGSMGEEQANIAAQAASFVDPMLDAGLDVRVAVTTTDDGAYWCRGSGVSDPESGSFVTSSCRERLADFYFSGNDTNAETACTDFCEFDALELSAPWIEASAMGSNLPAGITVGQALQCLLPQGINGCGFESTLESARKSILLAQSSGQRESGFLRDGAHLAVVFISDEADCSFNPDLQETVFGEEGVGNQVFWSLPDIQMSPTSAACWNAGVDCDFSQGADNCVSADKNVDGGPAATAAEAALHPVARFRDQLEAVRQAKLPLGAEVFAFGIVGVPETYASGDPLAYALGADAGNPESFQARFGIAPGCVSAVAEAVPPVRMRELVEGSAWGSNGKLYSVCSTDYGAAFSDIANTIVSYSP